MADHTFQKGNDSQSEFRILFQQAKKTYAMSGLNLEQDLALLVMLRNVWFVAEEHRKTYLEPGNPPIYAMFYQSVMDIAIVMMDMEGLSPTPEQSRA